MQARQGRRNVLTHKYKIRKDVSPACVSELYYNASMGSIRLTIMCINRKQSLFETLIV